MSGTGKPVDGREKWRRRNARSSVSFTRRYPTWAEATRQPTQGGGVVVKADEGNRTKSAVTYQEALSHPSAREIMTRASKLSGET